VQQVVERVAQQGEPRHHRDQERDVEPGDPGEDAGYVEKEERAYRDAEEGVAPTGGAVTVAVREVMVMAVAVAVIVLAAGARTLGHAAC
jgi:hypothetical protein